MPGDNHGQGGRLAAERGDSWRRSSFLQIAELPVPARRRVGDRVIGA
jgi:hypothetical protein